MGQSASLEDSDNDLTTNTYCDTSSFEPGAAPIDDNELKGHRNDEDRNDEDCSPPPGMKLSPQPPLPFLSHPQPSFKNMSNKFNQC